MELSNNLISQFAKLNSKTNSTSGELVYGTTVMQGSKLFVNIDGSDTITPVVTTSDVKPGERVTVMIKDHSATIMGNITNPSAGTEEMGKVLDEYDTIIAKIGNFELVVADKVSTDQLDAKLAIIDSALIGKASIAELNAVKATIKDLDVSKLEADIANINQAIINKADIADLDAIHADIDLLEADVANINTLIGGHLTMDNIQSLVLTSSKVTVDNAFIKDAMIDRVSASKINSGIINTNNVTIQSNDGSMLLKGTLQQFKDSAGNVRIQLGKDANGDFTFVLYGADGKGQLINQNGITASAISDGLIVNSMVSDNANISGEKLDINSVVTEINNGTETIKSSKVILDEKNQTFDVAFNKLSTTVDNIQVGGRNYIHQGRGNKQEGIFVDTSWTIAEDYAEATLTSQKTHVSIPLNKGFVKGIREYEVGDEYTWSYDIMFTNWNVPDESKLSEWWMGQRYTNATSESSDGAWRPVTQHNLPKMSSENVELNQWIHVEYTITIPEQAHSSIGFADSVKLYYSDPDTAATITFRIKNVKLEKGNKATDWTPAPEDTDSVINTVKETVNSQSTQLTVAQGQIQTLISNTTITKENGSTVSLKDDYSSFKQTVDGISSKVGSLETNYSKTLKSTKTMYYVSTSPTTLSGGSWSETSPTWTTGKYIWQKLVYVYGDGTTSDGKAVCIQGAKGDTGATGAKGDKGDTGSKGDKGDTGATGAKGDKGDTGSKGDTGATGATGAAGQSVTSVTPQFQKHTSNTTAPTGTWLDTCPAYESGKYLWVRNKVVFANPSATKYTNAYYDPSWDAKNTADSTAKEVTSKMSTFQQTLDGFTARVESVESTADSTTQKMSEITSSVNSISLRVSEKVDYDSIISAINLSPESIKINASKVNITGFVTFSDLSGSGTTTINGANIKTGYISGDRIKGGTLTAAKEINFEGGARIFGNTGELNAGLTISAAGFSLSGGSINYLGGNWYLSDGVLYPDNGINATDGVVAFKTNIDVNGYVKGTSFTCNGPCSLNGNMSNVGTAWLTNVDISGSTTAKGLSCSSIKTSGNVEVSGHFLANGNIYGMNNIALSRGSLYAPVGSATRDYLRFGTHLLSSDPSYGVILTDSAGDWTKVRCGTVIANGTTLSSDKRLKTDIKYINLDAQTIGENGLEAPNVNITTEDMHAFIETLPIASYRLKSDIKADLDKTYYGFIAQDILYSKVGSELIEYDVIELEPPVIDEEGNITKDGVYDDKGLRYSENKFITFICGALQEEIKQRKALERQLNDLMDTINK